MNRDLMRVRRGSSSVVAILLLVALSRWTAIAAPVDFNRDIRPILSDNCLKCHGPDEKARKADLRLDVREAALKPAKSGALAIVAGNAAKSELIKRITAKDEDDVMPPTKTGKKLTSAQQELLTRWIEEGAKYSVHWAFVPPKRPALPVVKEVKWSRNGIDPFVLARLEAENLKPSPETDWATWLRRVTFDLTGLPPTLAELDAFIADTSLGAYERVVDHLLASPRYGERMAIGWLDAARYADTSGYQSDGERTMWRWRDWVIDAFNRNLPFDQFTIEQLAGDLLPAATLQQKIATGFNRNHRGNAEGGIVPAEYAAEYVVDRVDTTATVWLGLTLGCARCHDHKYDPVTQREFYQLFAFFNNVPEKGRAVKIGNSPPYVKSPTDAQAAELAALDVKLAKAEKHFHDLQNEIRVAQSAWEKSLAAKPLLQWTVTNAMQVRHELDGGLASMAGTNGPAKFEGGESLFAPGHRSQAAVFDGKRFINCGDVGNFGFFDKFTLAAWIAPRGTRGGTLISRMVEQDSDSGFASDSEGYSVHLKAGRIQVHLTKRWLDDALRVETEAMLAPDQWRHVAVTYDGSRTAAGVKIFLNGEEQKLRVLLDELNQTFQSKQPLRIGAGGGPAQRFHGLMSDVRVYGRVLTAMEAGVIATGESLTELAARPVSKRTGQQQAKLRMAFLEAHGPAPQRLALRERDLLQLQRDALVENFPTTMVMEELPKPRDTFILARGEYDKPAGKVTPGFPVALLAKSGSAPKNRLDFARWLVSPQHPLTARVAVNHAWQNFFGAGLVRTVEDFGAQGEPPTHPELLDWLAIEFLGTGWDVKRLHRLIVLSATYRQSSRVTPALLARDPENRLLARSQRLRLPAEMVRDQALFAAGLLVEKIGGPSVMPYQPVGLWKELSGTDHVPGHGEKLWRRSLYTFWKRTSPPPAMMTFDAAGREACRVKQTRTSTPLQALTLLNDITFVEAARKLAERAMKQAGPTSSARLGFAFRLVTSREPNATELAVITAGFEQQLARFNGDTKAALQLVSIGEAARDPSLPVAELAAFTTAASLILNLDEAITRP